jgi:UDP-glucose:glycoprotein glucosyltransferase
MSIFRKFFRDQASPVTVSSDVLRIFGVEGHSKGTAEEQQTIFGEATSTEEVDHGHRKTYADANQRILSGLNLPPGASAILINGRVSTRSCLAFHVLIARKLVGPFEPREFSAVDFRMLASYELSKRVGPVLAALADVIPSFLEKDR